MHCSTHAYDNCKFFADRLEGGPELGTEGWLRIIAKGRREFVPGIEPARSALVVVDMDEGCVREWPRAIAKYNAELAEIRIRRAADVVIPNLVRLLEFFRSKELLVVYLTLGEKEVIPEIAPRGELVLRKYSAGAFATSALDNLLRERGIATIFCVGNATCGCVSATMRGAYDKLYQTILIEDGCFSSRPELHEAAVKIWSMYGFVRITDQVINDFPWQAWVDPGVRGEE